MTVKACYGSSHSVAECEVAGLQTFPGLSLRPRYKHKCLRVILTRKYKQSLILPIGHFQVQVSRAQGTILALRQKQCSHGAGEQGPSGL